MKLPFIGQTIDFNLGSLNFSPSYLQAGAIIVLFFLLIVSLAQIRRHFVDWSFRGVLTGLFFGFLFALILEGFLIIGGRTAVTEILGWKSAPKPVITILDKGRDKLVDVLGVTDAIPQTEAKVNPSLEDVINIFQTLDPEEAKKIKTLICQP